MEKGDGVEESRGGSSSGKVAGGMEVPGEICHTQLQFLTSPVTFGGD